MGWGRPASILHEITRAQRVWTLGFTGETVGELHSNFHRITAFRDRLRDGLLGGVLQRDRSLPFVYSYGVSFRWRSRGLLPSAQLDDSKMSGVQRLPSVASIAWIGGSVMTAKRVRFSDAAML